MKQTDIAIESPCGADWNAMQRGDKSRFCSDCKKTVHDLSAMSRVDAERLLAQPAQQELCVRYLHNEMGHVMFADTFRDRPIPLVALLRKRATQAIAASALGVSLTACMGARMGKVVPKNPVPAPAPAAATTPASPPATAPAPKL
jgi:hypothetical protein